MASDDRYRRAAAAGGVGVWDWDLATGEIYVDPFLKEMLGYEDHEIRNHLDDWGRFVHPDDAALVLDRANAHLAGEAPVYEVEHRMLHRDGSIRWFLARGTVTRDDRGHPVSIAGTDTDITERKLREEALRRAEEINKRIVESTGDCVAILDLDGRLAYVNRQSLDMFQLEDPVAALDRPLIGLFDENAAAGVGEAIAAARNGGSGRCQGFLRTSSPPKKWLDTVVTPITDGNGSVLQLLAVSRDLTKQRREETFRTAQLEMLQKIASGSKLPEVLDCLARLVEQLSDGMLCSVVLLDEDGTTIRHGAAPSLPDDYVKAIDGIQIGPRAGSCGTAMFRRSPVIVTDVLTDPLWENYREAARPVGLRACWSVPIFSPKRSVLGSLAMYYHEPRAPRDEEFWLVDTAAYIAGIAIEQQRAQQALRESEARNGAILRAIPDWMFLTTIDGIFLDYHVKDASRLSVEPSEFLGKSNREVLPADVADAYMAAFARVGESDEPQKIEYSMQSGDTERYYEAWIVSCDDDKILSIVRDVTDRKRAEVEAAIQRRDIAHLSRVVVLGELTGALAHELSQPLTAVLGNAFSARLLLDREPLDTEELHSVIEDIIKDNRRAGAVIDRLRALLRKDSARIQPINLNEIVREVVDLAHSEVLSRHISVTSTLTPAIPLVAGDRVQLQQVVLNLLLNACDAMDETPVMKRQLSLVTEMQDGHVQLIVGDCGTGIPADQLERIFEPFVTIGKQSVGLGLGLTISRSIMIAHHGSIQAENNPDGGATFRCILPLANSASLPGRVA